MQPVCAKKLPREEGSCHRARTMPRRMQPSEHMIFGKACSNCSRSEGRHWGGTSDTHSCRGLACYIMFRFVLVCIYICVMRDLVIGASSTGLRSWPAPRQNLLFEGCGGGRKRSNGTGPKDDYNVHFHFTGALGFLLAVLPVVFACFHLTFCSWSSSRSVCDVALEEPEQPPGAAQGLRNAGGDALVGTPMQPHVRFVHKKTNIF